MSQTEFCVKILICDDERAIAEKTKELVEEYFSEKGTDCSVDVFCSTKDVLENIRDYDIAFLDIEIDTLSGIDIGFMLKKANRNIIIFIVSAYNKYLDNAMDLGVFRFIMKPLEKERLFRSMDRALQLIDNRTIEFFLKDSGRAQKVVSDDIICVSTNRRGTDIITSDDIFETSDKISLWRERLSASFFFSPHNSYIINFKFVVGYTESEVRMANKFTVPISTRKKLEFKKRFASFLSER